MKFILDTIWPPSVIRVDQTIVPYFNPKRYTIQKANIIRIKLLGVHWDRTNWRVVENTTDTGVIGIR